MIYFEERNPNSGIGGYIECFEQCVMGKQRAVDTHLHDHMEILYCTAGNFEICVETQSATLQKGEMVLIRPMQVHQSRALSAGGNRYIVLKCLPEVLLSSLMPLYELKYFFTLLLQKRSGMEHYTAEQSVQHGLGRLMKSILLECTRMEYGYEIAVKAHVENLLLCCIRIQIRAEGSEHIREQDALLLNQVDAFIQEHLSETLTVDILARHFKMGRSNFSRFFNKFAGETFPAHLRRVRLTRAAAALRTTEKSVTEIAMETGFGTVSYFVKCFKKQTQVTPKQFRKRLGQDDA